MVREFSGKTYALDVDSQENMDDFLEEYGIRDPVWKEAAKTLQSTVTLTVEGDEFTQVTRTGDYSDQLVYRLDEAFEQISFDGRHIHSVVSADPDDENTHVQTQQFEDGVDVIIRKSYSEDKLVLFLTTRGVTAKRIYRAVSS